METVGKMAIDVWYQSDGRTVNHDVSRGSGVSGGLALKL